VSLLRRLLAPGLLRAQLSRTLLVGVVPLVILSLAVLRVSDDLIYERFRQESALVANGLAADIDERVLLVARYASLIAEIQQIRDVIVSGDAQGMKAQLLPLKGRLGLDIVDVADPQTGLIIAAAQDTAPAERLAPALLARMNARVESAWILDNSPGGLYVRAIAPVRAGANSVVAVVQTGVLIDDRLLSSLKELPDRTNTDASLAQLAIAWEGQASAVTIPALRALSMPSTDEIDREADRSLERTITIAGRPYYAVFTAIESHQKTLGLLAAFIPLDSVTAAHNAFITLIVVLLAVLVGAIGLLAYRFTASLTRPLGRLAAAARSVEAGELGLTIPSKSPHEIGALERSFETMVRSLAERDAVNRQLMSQLERQALYDTLTALPNRTLLHDRLRQTILGADREARGFGFILLDLDGFKDINDTFGHHVGDLLLREVGPRLSDVLRESDTVARFGGDEFALLLPTADEESGAAQAASKVIAALQRPFVIEGLSLQVEASLGIALYPVHGADATALVQHADAAMYEAKRTKSGYAMYSVGEEEASRDRLVLLGELRDAIERQQLSLHYQPAVDPRTRRIMGMEALVRWQHPRLGMLPAAKFVPFAEQTGLIRALSEWALRTAMAQGAHWASVGIDTPIAVNLSARDIPDTRLPDRIAQMLQESGVPASRLRLEITEGVVMSEPARSLETLRRLRDMGIDLSIDDFGTGYSSLSYLKRLPVAEIKIDRSFITDMLSDRGAAAIVGSTINLGHSLGLRVIAEGVESAEIATQLAVLGCDGIQGYFVSPALPADLIPAWIGDSQWRLEAEDEKEPVQLRPRRSL